jgi:hypothetical protein
MKTGNFMSHQSRAEYFRVMHSRYRRATRQEKADLLTEFCQVCGYHRKHAIRKLNQPVPDKPRPRRTAARGLTYDLRVVGVLRAVWEAAKLSLVRASEGTAAPLVAVDLPALPAYR